MDSVGKNGTIYEFDDFRLIPSEELLLRSGERVPLNHKALGVLAMLVERHGHLVQKAEIIDSIWEDSFVEEGSLTKAIWAVRHALGDTSKEGFIQTVPTRGYPFVSPVTVVSDVSGAFQLSDLRRINKCAKEFATETEQPITIGSNGAVSVAALGIEATAISPAANAEGVNSNVVLSTTSKNSSSSRRWIAAGILAVLIGAAFFLVFSGRKFFGSRESRGIAVLPIKPLDLQARDVTHDLGIAEALISKLSADKKLSIRRLEAVRGYLDVNQDPITAGKEQNVDYVLSSHYQFAGGKIKVTSQLIDVATGGVEENYTATSESADLFAAQDDIANSIGNRLLARFGYDSREFRPKRGTDNEQAYRHYQLAMNFIEQRSHPMALEHIAQAVALDPNFARAWATKAYIHRYVGSASDQSAREEQLQKSMEAVNEALAIDPNLSEAYGALCGSKNSYGYWAAGPEAVCKRAIELDPDSPLAHKNYSYFLYTRGRFDESIAEIKRAMELQPVSYDNQQVYALALYYARRYDESEAEWRRLIPLNPNHAHIYGSLANCLEQQGKESEAFEYRIKEMALRKEVDDEKVESLKAVYATSGRRGLSMERIKIVEAKTDPDPAVLARLYASIGDKDQAFRYLEQAYQLAVLTVDPQLDPIRDDPRFQILVARIER